MSIALFKYLFKAQGLDRDMQRGHRSIFLIKYLVQSEGSGPGDANTLVLPRKMKVFSTVDQDIQRELIVYSLLDIC